MGIYRNILLTALLIVAIVIAIELGPHSAPNRAEPELPASALELMDRRIPDFVLHRQSRRQAIEQLQRATGVPITVDWPAIRSWDNVAMDVELHDITLGDAVAYLFQTDKGFDFSVSAGQVDFDVVNGGLLITSAGKLPRSIMRLRIYDVRDLLTDQYWGCASGPDPIRTQAERIDALAKLIESLAAGAEWERPDRWWGDHLLGEHLGNGDIQIAAGRLFVTQTLRAQRQVAGALQRLRNGGISGKASRS